MQIIESLHQPSIIFGVYVFRLRLLQSLQYAFFRIVPFLQHDTLLSIPLLKEHSFPPLVSAYKKSPYLPGGFFVSRNTCITCCLVCNALCNIPVCLLKAGMVLALEFRMLRILRQTSGENLHRILLLCAVPSYLGNSRYSTLDDLLTAEKGLASPFRTWNRLRQTLDDLN